MGQKVAQIIITLVAGLMKFMEGVVTKETLTEGLYSLLPKAKYIPSLVHVTIDGKGQQVTETNLKKVIAELHERYAKAKAIMLTFVCKIPLSQEVVIDVKGKAVKTKFFTFVASYDYKARLFNTYFPGWEKQFSKEERELIYWRADMGLVQFAIDNKVKHVYGVSADKAPKE